MTTQISGITEWAFFRNFPGGLRKISGKAKSVAHQIKELEIKMTDEIKSQPIKEPTPEMMFANVVKSGIKNREEQTLSSMAFRITNLQTKKMRKLERRVLNKVTTRFESCGKKKKAIRLGTFNEEKNRPIKVSFATMKEKEIVMKNLKNLKGIEGYGKRGITEDHTKAERELIKTWSNKAKDAKNSFV